MPITELATPASPIMLSPKSNLSNFPLTPVRCSPMIKSARFFKSSRQCCTFWELCFYIFFIYNDLSEAIYMGLVPDREDKMVFVYSNLSFGACSLSSSSLTTRDRSLSECIMELTMVAINQAMWDILKTYPSLILRNVSFESRLILSSKMNAEYNKLERNDSHLLVARCCFVPLPPLSPLSCFKRMKSL